MTQYKYFPEKPGAIVSINNGTIIEVIDIGHEMYLSTELAGYLLHLRVPNEKLKRMPWKGDSVSASELLVSDYGFRVDGEPYAILSAVRPPARVWVEQP